MRKQRERNARKGIIMRRGRLYRGIPGGMPDGSDEPDCMSPTGRERDCICDGRNPAHHHLALEELNYRKHPWRLRWARLGVAVSEWWAWHFKVKSTEANLREQFYDQGVSEGRIENSKLREAHDTLTTVVLGWADRLKRTADAIDNSSEILSDNIADYRDNVLPVVEEMRALLPVSPTGEKGEPSKLWLAQDTLMRIHEQFITADISGLRFWGPIEEAAKILDEYNDIILSEPLPASPTGEIGGGVLMIAFTMEPDRECECDKWEGCDCGPEHRARDCGGFRVHECLQPTATLIVNGPEDLREGLPDLLKWTSWCPRWGEFSETRHPNGECCHEIARREVVYTGQEDISKALREPDPGCTDCKGSGEIQCCCDELSGNFHYLHKEGCPYYEARPPLPPCPCRRYDLSGVDEVRLEAATKTKCPCHPEMCPRKPGECVACDQRSNLAAAREQLEARGVEVT